MSKRIEYEAYVIYEGDKRDDDEVYLQLHQINKNPDGIRIYLAGFNEPYIEEEDDNV